MTPPPISCDPPSANPLPSLGVFTRPLALPPVAAITLEARLAEPAADRHVCERCGADRGVHVARSLSDPALTCVPCERATMRV